MVNLFGLEVPGILKVLRILKVTKKCLEYLKYLEYLKLPDHGGLAFRNRSAWNT